MDRIFFLFRGDVPKHRASIIPARSTKPGESCPGVQFLFFLARPTYVPILFRKIALILLPGIHLRRGGKIRRNCFLIFLFGQAFPFCRIPFERFSLCTCTDPCIIFSIISFWWGQVSHFLLLHREIRSLPYPIIPGRFIHIVSRPFLEAS